MTSCVRRTYRGPMPGNDLTPHIRLAPNLGGRGRRKSDEQKRLEGTYRADRAGGKPASSNAITLPPPPEHLGDRARLVWLELAEVVDPLRIMTAADVPAFEMLAVAIAICREASVEIARDGLVIEIHGSQGQTRRVQHPPLAILATYQKNASMMLTRFDMAPSERSRVTGIEDSKDDCPWAEFCDD